MRLSPEILCLSLLTAASLRLPLHLKTESVLDVTLAEVARLLRRSCRALGLTIKFHDRPVMEVDGSQCGDHSGQINRALPKLDELITAAGVSWLHILEMNKQQTVSVLPHGCCRVSPTLLVMCNVEQKLHIARIGCVQNSRELLRRLSDGPHMIVKCYLHSVIRSPLADFGKQFPRPNVLVGSEVSVGSECAENLEIHAAGST